MHLTQFLKRPQIRLVLAVLVISTAIWAFFHFSQNEFSSMNTEQLKTKVPLQAYCIGRLQFDLPTEGDLMWGSGMVGGIQVNAETMSMTPYFQQVRTREQELRDQAHGKGGSLLIEATTLSDTIYAGLLLHFWSSNGSKDFADYEGYKYLGEYKLTALAFESLEDGGKIGNRRQEVIDALNAIKPLPKDISKLDGACMLAGFVSGRAHASERLDADVVWESKYPALRISIATDARENDLASPDESMLKRIDDNSAMISQLFPDSSILRKRTRKVGVWDAEELAVIDKDKDGDESYTFKLKANQPKTGLQYPSISIEMQAAREAYGKLSRNELLALWDAIIESIRVRQLASN